MSSFFVNKHALLAENKYVALTFWTVSGTKDITKSFYYTSLKYLSWQLGFHKSFLPEIDNPAQHVPLSFLSSRLSQFNIYLWC